MDIIKEDIEALRREKYAGDPKADMQADIARLSESEPLAYVIGTQPFLGLTLHLDSKPLIPRPETEWWTEKLIKHIGTRSCHVLDLCAGSGAVGLAILKHCPNTVVSFGELIAEHEATILKNVHSNGVDPARVDIRIGDLFTPFTIEERDTPDGTLRLGQAARSGVSSGVSSGYFDIIATNPPYIPNTRALSASVTQFEPAEALFAGTDGLDVIKTIATETPRHLNQGGELWMECDIENIVQAKELLDARAVRTEIQQDQYDRPRLVIAYYP